MAEWPTSGGKPRTESTRFIERLVDLELPVAVVLGRAQVRVRDVIKLTAGSLVELDRRAGDRSRSWCTMRWWPAAKWFPSGGNYGVKIQEVISRKDRYRSADVRCFTGHPQSDAASGALAELLQTNRMTATNYPSKRSTQSSREPASRPVRTSPGRAVRL